jgi:hypothetical protein
MSVLCTAFRPDLGVLYVQRVSSAGLKRQGREADHSPPASKKGKERVPVLSRLSTTP